MTDTLYDLVHDYGSADCSERRKQLEAEIWTQFGTECTVLVWDMSNFSLLTRRHGIIHYLSMIRRMQEVTRAIVLDHHGSMVKFEADNGFAVFPHAEPGIRAAIAMNAAFVIENSQLPEEFGIHISCGLDHGRIILLEGKDFFGDAVNIASKLGEDLASAGEILASKAMVDRLPEDVSFDCEPLSFSISGLQLEATRIGFPMGTGE